MSSKARPKPKRRLRKALFWLIVAAICWPLATGALIWQFGHTDYARHSDCIIVLGAAAYHKKPSPVFRERIRHAITLLDDGKAEKIIFTGGYGDGAAHAESEVAALYAVEAGVAEDVILTEKHSRSTRQNLLEAKKLMDANGLNNAIIVSDPLHLKRAATMAADIGMAAVTSPTPTSRFRSLDKKLEFLLREVYFYSRYLLWRLVGTNTANTAG